MEEFRKEEYRKELMERYGDRLMEKYERSRHRKTELCEMDMPMNNQPAAIKDDDGEQVNLADAHQANKPKWDISLIMGIVAVIGLVVLFVCNSLHAL